MGGHRFDQIGRQPSEGGDALRQGRPLDYSRAGVRVLAREARELITHRIEDVLPRVQSAVRVVRGKRDHIVPQAWAEAVARMARAPAPAVVPRWGHAVHYDSPEPVAQVAVELAHHCTRSRAGRGAAEM